MKRPALHDERFAMSSDLRAHIEAQDEYITYLEGGLDALKQIVATLDSRPKPAAMPPFDDILRDFFGPKK